MAETKKRKRRGERKDGRILLTLVIGRDSNGKPVRKYFYGNTRQEAEKKREEYKRMQEYGMAEEADEMTVNEWIDIWYAKYKEGQINPHYEKNYLTHVKRLRKALGHRLVKGIREADLQQCLYSVSHMSSSTIDKYYQVIQQVFSKARRNKIIMDDPSEDLRVPEGTEGSHRALESWEYDCVLQNWHEHRSGLWAMLMLLCGLRRSEMMALRWEHVDMEARQVIVCEVAVISHNQTVIVDRTKSAAGMRRLPICDPLYKALDSVPQNMRNGFVCRSARGAKLSESSFDCGWVGFNNAMTRILNGEPPVQKGRRSDLERDRVDLQIALGKRKTFSVLAHDLRHTFATALYDAEVDPKSAQYYLGHSDIRMTLDLYTHLSNERENRERSKLTNFLDGWIKKEP